MNLMSATDSPIRDLAHSDLGALARALNASAVWFSVPGRGGLDALPDDLKSRLSLHRFQAASCLTVDGLHPGDLPALAGCSGLALINQPDILTPRFPEGQVAHALNAQGFKLFFRPGGAVDAVRLSNRAQIGALEFLLSDSHRLKRYPTLGTGRPQQALAQPRVARRAVVLLDLVQDFEVLRPLMALGASPRSGLDLCVAVTERHAKSPLWPLVKNFLEVHDLSWFTPLGSADVAAALGRGRSLLLTASESTAAAHAFAHLACRAAPPRTVRITVQHGLECIGLRHHRAHDLDFPQGVRFASDIVLTWDHPDRLPDLHPAEAHKCIAVGVIKALAERADTTSDRQWSSLGDPALAQPRSPGRPTKVLIAENLHSVRFRAPARHQRFLSFIQQAAQDPDLTVTVRSHPASRTLEKMKDSNGLNFLGGALRLEDLAAFDRVVSPPSTVLLDAALAGASAAVWSDARDFGDAVHYSPLPVVTDLPDLHGQGPGPRGSGELVEPAWATRVTAALNGVPSAWSAIQNLMQA